MKKFDIYEHPFFGREVVKKGFVWPAFFFSFIWAWVKGMNSVATSLISAMILLPCPPVLLLYVLFSFFARQEEATMVVASRIIFGLAWFGLSLLTGFYASKWRGYHLRNKGYKLVKTVPENPDNLVTRKANMSIPARALAFLFQLRRFEGYSHEFEFKGYSHDKHDGQKYDHWICRFSNGDEEEGPYKNGKKHGDWVFRFANGDVSSGHMENDKQHGLWVHRLANGGMQIGPYKGGKKHGCWVEQTEDVFRGGRLTTFFDRLAVLFAEPVYRAANSDVFKGQYKNGREHGHWILWAANGSHGESVNQSIPWVLRATDGDVAEGSYKDGKAHGLWIFRYADGRVKKIRYEEGKVAELLDDTGEVASASDDIDAGIQRPKIRVTDIRISTAIFALRRFCLGRFAGYKFEFKGCFRNQHGQECGQWVERFIDEGVQCVLEGPIVKGKKHGQWIERAQERVDEGPYVKGRMRGHWVFRHANGDVSEGLFVNGKQTGHWVTRLADGNMQEGALVDGKQHGRWVYRNANGDVSEHCFENGNEVDC